MSNGPLFSVSIDLFEGVAIEEFEYRIVVGGTRRGGVAVDHGTMGDGEGQLDAWGVGKALRSQFYDQVLPLVPFLVMRME